MLSINTNLSSIITQNNMKQSTNKLNEAIERMTTGYKINHAKDNAANYSISTNMTTKIGAYDVAADNVAMGMDMLTTASESMTQMENLGKRLRALNTQARNGTYGKQSLNAIQAEANSIIDEINRLYSTAKYNGISLFNQKEYDIPEGMPQADPVTGFIEDPYDYTEEQIAEMISISKVDSFESGKTYSISSAKELKRLADIVNDGNTGEGSTFVLTADIDLSEYSSGEGWTPIGNYGVDINLTFNGTFNGNGHIISNLTINRPTADYQGLFGYATAGSVSNLGINSVNIVANSHVGVLGGFIARAINCFVEGNIKAYAFLGGLSGVSSSIENCYSNCNIDGRYSTGGLVGELQGSIYNSFVLGDVFATHRAGGIIGQIYNPIERTVEIKNSLFLGLVSGNIQANCIAGSIRNTYDGITIGKISIEDCFAREQEAGLFEFTPVDGTVYDDDMDEMLAGIKETRLRELSTNLQVGTKSDSNSQIDFNTNFEYALGRIVRNGIHTDEALNLITDFLNTMSDKQTQLGAVQNRLESAMDEIITQHDNLISARSTLRDADMAELSSAYIQQQILQEASATLMATANQSPAIALQLI